jgi:hypothetical protein
MITTFSRVNLCLVSPMKRDKSLFLNLAVKRHCSERAGLSQYYGTLK